LLGQVLSDKLGFAIVVQHDPYRIFVQTLGRADATRLVEVFDELKTMPEQVVKDTLTKSTIKTGLFKRRVIHVARRFGALKKWADFSNVSLQKLIQSFEGTPIYEEGLKEVFTKDLSLDGVVAVLKQMQKEKIELVAVDNKGSATPVARTGIERVSMKTDLIPPERMHAVLVESAKARLLNETGGFICTNCWSYSEMIRIADLPDRPKCPCCGSQALGLLKVEAEKADMLVEKKAQKLTKDEERLREVALETARLMEKYGKPAAVALSARKVRISDIAEVLEKESALSDNFYELVLDAERKALSKRFS
jgi:ATP-dependent Lhr-like helicase